jgi:hypothetical protein
MRDARWQMMPTALVMVEDRANARRCDATRCRLRFFEKTEAETRGPVGGVGRPAANEAGSGDPRPTSGWAGSGDPRPTRRSQETRAQRVSAGRRVLRAFAGLSSARSALKLARSVCEGHNLFPRLHFGIVRAPSLALRVSVSAHDDVSFWAARGISGFAESFRRNSIPWLAGRCEEGWAFIAEGNGRWAVGAKNMICYANPGESRRIRAAAGGSARRCARYVGKYRASAQFSITMTFATFEDLSGYVG